MNVNEQRLKLEGDGDVVAAWKAGMALGRRLGLPVFKQACFSSAILELSRVAVQNGRTGVCVLRDESDARAVRARVVIETSGREAAEAAKERLRAELAVGPALPSVRLQQVADSCSVDSEGDRTRLSLAIGQARRPAAVPAPRLMPVVLG